MSLRQRLRHDRMTVRPLEPGDGVHRGGLLWRIRGPVANESDAERRARERSLTWGTLGWCPLIGLAVFFARKILAIDSSGLWLVLAAVVAVQAAGIYLNYLLARPLFRHPRRLAIIGLAPVLLILSGGKDIRGAVFIHLPLALAGAALLARLVTAEHLRWSAEAPGRSWQERDSMRDEADGLPLVGMKLVVSYAAAFLLFEATRRGMPAASAGTLALLVVLVSPWVLLELTGRSALRAAASAWEVLVLWLTYNHHEWYGPQTFQFDCRVRRPAIRKAAVWVATLLLGAAIVCVSSEPPQDVLRAVASAIGDAPPIFETARPQLDRPSGEVRMSKEQERYYKLLPTDSEKRRYRESLRRREIAREEAAEAERGGSIEDQLRSLALTVIAPPLLLFTILAASQGTVRGFPKEE
jgi:hypothetical protein